MATKVSFLDNSGFLVETDTKILVFDYYRDPAQAVVKALKASPEKEVIFFVSHNHPDHLNTDIFNLAQSHKHIYVLSNDIPTREIHDTMPIDWMSAGDTIENIFDDVTVHAYHSTDKGVSYFVTLGDGSTIFHAGDLNNWHWDEVSDEKEIAKAHSAFTTVLNRIASEHGQIDTVFFPVDTRLGAHCALGASQFLDAIKVKDFFPMHFKGSFEKACDFTAYPIDDTARKRTVMHCLHKPGETIEI